MGKYLIYFGNEDKKSTMHYQGLLVDAVEYVNNDLFYYSIVSIVDDETGVLLSTKTNESWEHTVNSITYSIVDNEGGIYAHDIRSAGYAKTLLCDIIADLSKRIKKEEIDDLDLAILEDFR